MSVEDDREGIRVAVSDALHQIFVGEPAGIVARKLAS